MIPFSSRFNLRQEIWFRPANFVGLFRLVDGAYRRSGLFTAILANCSLIHQVLPGAVLEVDEAVFERADGADNLIQLDLQGEAIPVRLF